MQMTKKMTVVISFIIAFVGFVLTSCCDEDEITTPPNAAADDSYWVETRELPENSISLSKGDGIPVRKWSYVFYNYGDPTDPSMFDRYKTVRIKDGNKMFHQEWLLEDFRDTIAFIDYIKRPDDSDGRKYGVYYRWNEDWQGLKADSFYDMFMEKDGTTIAEGFHVPTETDIQILEDICGKKNFKRMATFINIGYDGLYDSFGRGEFTDLPNAGVFWFDAKRSGYNPHPTCGAYAHFAYPSASFLLHYPNGPYVYANVRLVRNLSPNE